MAKLSTAWQWLKQQEINRGMVPVKAFGFFLNFGVQIIFPYLTVQMLSMGMNVNDISFVYGAIPFFTVFASPLAGFIGDRIGYNVVFIVNLIIAATSATAFNWTPRFKEYYRNPTLKIGQNPDAQEATVLEFIWPLEGCNVTTNSTDIDCMYAPILGPDGDNFWNDVVNFIHCGSGSSNPVFDIPPDPDLPYVELFTNGLNGTMCRARAYNGTLPIFSEVEFFTVCNFTDIPLNPCHSTEGSHTVTFWTYFALRMIFQITILACYACIDGTALRKAKEHGSHFTWVLLYTTMAQTIAPLVAAATIIDAPEGSGEENDYKIAFYVYDASLFLALLISFKLKVTLGTPDEEGLDKTEVKKKRNKETRQALKYIFSKPALIYYGILFNNGILWGVVDAFVLIYLQEYLGASSELIGYMNFVGVGIGLLVFPFGQQIVEKLGHINMLFVAILMQSTKLVIYSVVHQSPPYFIYGTALMEVLIFHLGWLSALTYSYKIAPPPLIGTMAAVTGAINWIVAKGLGSFVAGQLIDKTPLTIEQVFQLLAGICSAGATVFYIIYLTVGRRLEKELLKKMSPQVEKLVKGYIPISLGDPFLLTRL